MLYSTSRPTTMTSNTPAYAPTPSSLGSNSTSSASSSRNNSIASMSSSSGIMSFTPSVADPIDVYSLSHSRTNSYASTSRCAYPSWPTGAALVRNSSQQSNASAYISDEDLFGEDDEPYLSEPPPPPRSAEVWLAKPLLPPVVEVKPRRTSVHFSKTHKKRSGSNALKQRKE